MQKEILSFSKIHIGAEEVITGKYDELLMKGGKVLKDTMSGLWNVPLGYSNDRIKQSMINQLVKLPYASNFSGYHSQTTEQYANEICKRTKMSRVYFTNSGSAAVETAIKLSGKNITFGATVELVDNDTENELKDTEVSYSSFDRFDL